MILEIALTLTATVSKVDFETYLENEQYCFTRDPDFMTFTKVKPKFRKKYFRRLYLQGYNWKVLRTVERVAKETGYWDAD